jgi:hypothetical protein
MIIFPRGLGGGIDRGFRVIRFFKVLRYLEIRLGFNEILFIFQNICSILLE